MIGRLKAIGAFFAVAILVSGCSAMMLGGSGGAYEPPPDECSARDRDRGLC
jgi:hypothetical protein